MSDVLSSFSDYEGVSRLREEDVFCQDGILYCSRCGCRISEEIEPDSELARAREFLSLPLKRILECDCMKNAAKSDAGREARRREMTYILKKNCSLGKLHEKCTFADTITTGCDVSFIQAYARCKSFCEKFPAVKERGCGIYLFGGSGKGKTHLLSCIANEVISKYLCDVSYISAHALIELYRENRASASKMLGTSTLLLIDDIGSESFTGYNGQDLQNQTYMHLILDEREESGLPTVFASRMSIEELEKNRGLSEASRDRLEAMSSVTLPLYGASFRKRRNEERGALPF